jgi:hypothetical protein
MPIRVFKYGLLAPTVNGPMVLEQMLLAHRYRNVLVEIERERRATVQAVLALHPDMAPLESKVAGLAEQYEAAQKALGQARTVRQPRAALAPQREELRRLAAELRETRAQIKAGRKEVYADTTVRAQLDAADEHAKARVKEARKLCGVYWGTYLLQEADADRARQEKTPPKFRRWDEQGRVSVQVQGGISVDELLGSDTRVRVAPVASVAHDEGCRRGDRRRAQRTTLMLRIGSDEDSNRIPIWAEFPMIYHRPIPPGSTIKVATVSRSRHNCWQWDWNLTLTVDVPETAMRGAPVSGVVALNLGFCQRPDGALRAGYLVASDGTEQEILLPSNIGDAVSKASSIRSFRDKNMDTMKSALTAWLGDLTEAHDKAVAIAIACADHPWGRVGAYIRAGGPALPPWLAEIKPHLHAWRSADRFRKLAQRWRVARFHGDEVGYEALDAWRYRDNHLEPYETGMRRRALLRRREGYRILASNLCQRYRTLVIDDTDLAELKRSPAPESEEVDGIPLVKNNQSLVAGSELRQVLMNAFHGRVEKMSSNDVTRRCYSCGHVDEAWDQSVNTGRGRTCPACGLRVDQDANACRNLLLEWANAQETPETARTAKSAIAKPSRSQRLRTARSASTTTRPLET